MTIRVLIADDHVIMRDGLKALLSANSDIEVVAEVGNGRDAVRQAQRFKPNVILMDLAMPELNGIEAAGLLREACPEARIVMLSMHSTSEHLYRALEAGVTGYVLKESAAREVVAAVRAAYVGQRYLSQALADRVDLNPASRRAGPLDSLSARERQVLQLVVEGHSSADIAARVHLSRKSVETYRSRLMKKLGVSDLAALVKFAIQHGITPSG